jgi:hypothetical protein
MCVSYYCIVLRRFFVFSGPKKNNVLTRIAAHAVAPYSVLQSNYIRTHDGYINDRFDVCRIEYTKIFIL